MIFSFTPSVVLSLPPPGVLHGLPHFLRAESQFSPLEVNGSLNMTFGSPVDLYMADVKARLRPTALSGRDSGLLDVLRLLNRGSFLCCSDEKEPRLCGFYNT